MASVNIAKVKSASSGRHLVNHMTRHDGQENYTYKNKDIDPRRRQENWVVGDTGETGKAVLKRLREEVKQIDQEKPPQRVRADRVTLTTVSVPCPEELTHDLPGLREFFRIAYETLREFCGGHCSPGYVHMDEVHEYRDKGGEIRESRPHLHMAMLPYTDQKGINCKAFMSRDRLRFINREIDARVFERLGIHMLTGEAPDRIATERLKAMSAKREVEYQEAKLKQTMDMLERAGGLYERVQTATRELEDQVSVQEKRAQNAAIVEQASKRSAEAAERKIEAFTRTIEAIQEAGEDRQPDRNGNITLSKQEYDAMAYAARNLSESERTNRRKRQILQEAREEAEGIISQAERQARQKTITDRLEAAELREENRSLRAFIAAQGLAGVYATEQEEKRTKEQAREGRSLSR